MSDKGYTKWSDEKLQAEADSLAEARTAIRLQQNAVADEIAIRVATKGMSEDTRKRFNLRLGGESTSEGGKE